MDVATAPWSTAQMPSSWIAAGSAAAFLAIHLAAEARGIPLARVAGKMGASVAFVALALARGVDGPFERAILAGLVLSAVGDAFLLSARRGAFLAGLAAFLLAHVAYAVAFAGVARAPPWTGVLVLAVTGAAVRALWPRLDGMQAPVLAYGLAIGAMLWLALGVDRAVVRGGALLFYLSDLLVARDRFVRAGLENRLIGLPLYYAGQLLLAASVG
jgi:uncharacterized membrane protein YhhN